MTETIEAEDLETALKLIGDSLRSAVTEQTDQIAISLVKTDGRKWIGDLRVWNE